VVTTGATVVAPGARAEALPDGAVAAGKGSRVTLVLPRRFSLSPGVYAEYVVVTVVERESGQPST